MGMRKSIATALALGLLMAAGMTIRAQPAACSNCLNHCYSSGAYCGYNCACLCHDWKCACFAVYRVGEAQADGWN